MGKEVVFEEGIEKSSSRSTSSKQQEQQNPTQRTSHLTGMPGTTVSGKGKKQRLGLRDSGS